MPEISRFFGIVIRMYWREHGPPHFHAQYGQFDAVFSIETGGKIAGKFPKKGQAIIEGWARQYKKELLLNWDLIKKQGRFRKIKGADQ